MKKIYLAFFVLISSVTFSQSYNRYYNSWRLGLNMGGMWQTADVRSTAGVAGGFTLEKGILENEMHFFSLAIRGRGLFGNTYGLDFGRNYNVKDNPAFNGTYNPAIRYDTTSGYVYNNYKTQISEGALELQVSFNRLRVKTGIILNLWGGVGISGFRANTNLLGSDDKMYNYYKVDSAGTADQGTILSANKNLMDKTYESYANGHKAKNLITFSPSAGIGLGYQLGHACSIIFEYKVTFPQGFNADYLDGIVGTNNDPIAKHKDYYHYAGVNFVFTLRGKGGKSTSTNVSNYTPANTNTTTTYVPPTQTVSTAPALQPPVVKITAPSASPYTQGSPPYTIKATISNISSRSQVNVNYNGIAITNFNYYNGTIDFPVVLNLGSNNVTITGTNKAGSDSKSATLNYVGNPPQITITNPASNPYTSNSSPVTINANIINVSSSNDITAKFNGAPVNFFSYSLQNNLFSVQLPLLKGNNSLEITAVNNFGRDAKTQTIIYTPTVNVGTTNTAARPMAVVILDPATNPYTVKTSNYDVKSKVTNVSSASQVTVTVNGAPVNFNFASGSVTFNAPLNLGANNITVSGKNAVSSDSKSTVIIYEMDKVIAPPKVTIIHPSPSPHSTNLSSYNFRAFVQNVNNKNQLEVKLNGNVMTNFAFSSESGNVDLNSNLITGNNIFEVKATNADGSANASATVVYKLAATDVNIDPPITICHNGPRGTKTTITIKQSEWTSHQAHGDVQGSCPNLEGENVNLDPDITICHKGPGASRTTMTIKQSQWVSHQAHGDVQGACPNIEGGNINIDPDLVICHKNNDGTRQTLTIKQSQWVSHQSHGDTQGECPSFNPGEVNLDPEITICHKNSDGSKSTMKIRQSAWSSHQSHGDEMGACPKATGTTGGGVDPDIIICHKESNGARQTLTIKQSEWANHQAHGDQMGACGRFGNVDPDKIICHKNSDGTKQTMTIKLSEWAAHEAHGDVEGTCPVEDPDITICHKNADGSKLTMTIKQSQWSSHQSHGDVMGVCPASGSMGGPKLPTEEKKITICHIPPGNTGNPQTIEIPESAWPAHEAHGDTKGECPPQNNGNNGGGNNGGGNSGGNNNGPEKKITICHIPPGNTGNPQTIEIPESAWPAHEAHGDTKGECPPQNNGNNGGGNNGGGNSGGNNNGPEKKITICHIPPGNTGNPQTIEIPESAWPAHEAHGDTKGACAPQNNGNNGNNGGNNNSGGNNGGGNNNSGGNSGNSGGGKGGGEEKKITICHIPPGNKANPQTIEIPESAWPAHEAHGDTKGACANSKKEVQPNVAPQGGGRPGRTMVIEEKKEEPKETPKETPKPAEGGKPFNGRPR